MGRSRGNKQKHTYWQEHFRLWKESGLSQMEYCRTLTEIQPAPAMRLLIDRGYCIEIERGFCAETLDRLLGVLEGR